MRVIAGKAKGHSLTAPRGLDIRPTSDRAKEAIFNILGDTVREADVLDLYAGTGSLGIEALSRGGRLAVFVDHDQRALKSLDQNLKKTGLEEQTQVFKADVIQVLKSLQKDKRQFDLIFLDPPYRIDLAVLERVLSSLGRFNLLTQRGKIVLEHSSRNDISIPKELELVDKRKYGDTAWTILKAKEPRGEE